MTLKSVLILLGTLLLITALSFTYVLRSSLPVEDASINIAGLHAPVSVNLDKLGIPSIEASNRTDAYRILGYLHARDRLFQMELMRRKSAGRLAEIFGERLLKLDVSQKDYVLEIAAKNIVSALPAAQKQVLDAYVAGINAWISSENVLPPEFVALNLHPEPWRAEDSLLVALGMFQNLNGHEQDERMVSVMEQALPKTLVNFLTPDTDIYATVLVGGFDSRRPAQAIPVHEFAELNAQTESLTQTAVDIDHVIAGSNNWVVAGSKTLNGKAMLANDMHLGLNAPNIWYRTELRYGDHYFNGVTLPGVPSPIVGSNQYVAWGFTNVTGDLLDLITLEINPKNPEEYRIPQGWQRFDKSQTIIKVKNSHDVLLEQRTTRWGPVSSKLLLDKPVVIKWTALDPAAVDLGLLDMDGVKTTQEAMTLINKAGGPAQNVVFADQDGHIGWTYMGRFPNRKGFDGMTSRSWADARLNWEGFIPDEQLPRLFDPPEGFIVTANNRTVGREYPFVIGHNWSLGYRAHRITELLRQSNNISEQEMLEIQLDTRSEVFEFYRQLALTLLNSSTRNDALIEQSRQALLAWDGHMHKDSKGAALLSVFRHKLADLVFAKVVARCNELDPDFHYAWREMETPLRDILQARPKGVLPAQYQDDWEKAILEVLNSSAQDLQHRFPEQTLDQLNWGTFNRVAQQHPFSKSIPQLTDILDIAHFESPGCAGNCVRAMTSDHGASERLVLAPADPEQGILEMPGGQSGHPFSAHYRDQQQDWLEGNATPFLPGNKVHHLQFQPIESVKLLN